MKFQLLINKKTILALFLTTNKLETEPFIFVFWYSFLTSSHIDPSTRVWKMFILKFWNRNLDRTVRIKLQCMRILVGRTHSFQAQTFVSTVIVKRSTRSEGNNGTQNFQNFLITLLFEKNSFLNFECFAQPLSSFLFRNFLLLRVNFLS